MKVERESVTKTRFSVKGGMINPRVAVDVVTDNKLEPMVLTVYLSKCPSMFMSVDLAEAIVAALTAAIPEAQAVVEKDDE